MADAATHRRIIPGPGARASFARAIADIEVGDEVAISTHAGLEKGRVTKFYGRAGVQIRRAHVNYGVERQKVYLKVEHIRYIEPIEEFKARFATPDVAAARSEVMDQFDAFEDEVYADDSLSADEKRARLAEIRADRDAALAEVSQ